MSEAMGIKFMWQGKQRDGGGVEAAPPQEQQIAACLWIAAKRQAIWSSWDSWKNTA